jgi:hypothetical protein
MDFEKFTNSKFEELYFDLLWRMSFHSLTSRQGGEDSGRDIEARYALTNPIVGG